VNFVNYAQMHQDVREWAPTLGKVKCIAGIPRSGMLVASTLGLQLNVPVVSVYDLLDPSRLYPQLQLRRGDRDIAGSLLVIDDTCATGGTLRNWRNTLELEGWEDIKYGAMYALDAKTDGLDFHHQLISWPRRFEWNVFHSRSAQLGLFDMDGVLCEDECPEFGPQPDPGDPKFDEWDNYLATKKPLYIPSVPILGVVTSRLERDRRVTEDWLARHGVQYGQLHMTPYKSAADRRKAGRHGYDKATVYKKYGNTQLFFESSEKQSRQIAEVSGRAVLWVGGMEVIMPAAKKT
jgi:hypoxanthine phosphoribosyltransferase/uncharacterized HAD superfamily protein